MGKLRWASWYKLVIPALSGWRWESEKFKVSLGYNRTKPTNRRKRRKSRRDIDVTAGKEMTSPCVSKQEENAQRFYTKTERQGMALFPTAVHTEGSS